VSTPKSPAALEINGEVAVAVPGGDGVLDDIKKIAASSKT
jgi:hypothetical protein